jgi:hypothetical protein
MDTEIDYALETRCFLGRQSNSNVSASVPGESWLDMSSHRMLQATDAGRGRVLKIAQSTCWRTLRSQNNLRREHDTSGRMRRHTHTHHTKENDILQRFHSLKRTVHPNA